jgi:murein DD-endopeptidase MepM/ murein hydrolase activator NlpD
MFDNIGSDIPQFTSPSAFPASLAGMPLQGLTNLEQSIRNLEYQAENFVPTRETENALGAASPQAFQDGFGAEAMRSLYGGFQPMIQPDQASLFLTFMTSMMTMLQQMISQMEGRNGLADGQNGADNGGAVDGGADGGNTPVNNNGNVVEGKKANDLPYDASMKDKFKNPCPDGKFSPYKGDSGCDIAAPRGTPVYAARDGVIVYNDPKGHTSSWEGPGNDTCAVMIKHDDGTQTFYCHMSGRNTALTPGTKVKQGQYIGNVGVANNVSHLHFSIYKPPGGLNDYVDPFETQKILQQNG